MSSAYCYFIIWQDIMLGRSVSIACLCIDIFYISVWLSLLKVKFKQENWRKVTRTVISQQRMLKICVNHLLDPWSRLWWVLIITEEVVRHFELTWLSYSLVNHFVIVYSVLQKNWFWNSWPIYSLGGKWCFWKYTDLKNFGTSVV